MSFPSVSAELKVMPSFKTAIDTGSSQIAKDLLASVKRNFPEHRKTAGTVLHDLEKFSESTNDDRESNITKNKLMVADSQLAIDAAYDQKSANRKARDEIAERKAKNKLEFDRKQAEEDKKLSETLENDTKQDANILTEEEFVKMMQPCINDFETINNNKDYLFHTVRVSIVKAHKYYHLENADKVDERVTSPEIGRNTIWALLAGGMHHHKHHGDEDPMKDVSFHDIGKWGQ